MVEYIDSSGGRPEGALGHWLTTNLVAGTRSFRCQSGFFGLGSLRDRLETLRGVEVIRLVLGSNAPEQPTVEDVRALVPLLTDGATRSLTIVRCAGSAMFHPKCIHLMGPDGVALGYVGSANATEAGFGRNIEAGVILGPGSEGALAAMAAAIDAWAARGEEGVFQIHGLDDLEPLVAQGVLVTAAARRASRAAVRTVRGGERRGGGFRIGAMWRPATAAAAEQAADEGRAEAVAEGADGYTEVVRVPHLRWCKRLPRNDAQQPSNPNSNVRGILGLSQAGFSISIGTYFRDQFFGLADWVDAGEKEECHVLFDVDFPGRAREQRVLKISHKSSREADQANISTHLHWGHDLIAWLRANSQVGNWVVLERHEDGTYSLAITEERPDWAP